MIKDKIMAKPLLSQQLDCFQWNNYTITITVCYKLCLMPKRLTMSLNGDDLLLWLLLKDVGSQPRSLQKHNTECSVRLRRTGESQLQDSLEQNIFVSQPYKTCCNSKALWNKAIGSVTNVTVELRVCPQLYKILDFRPLSLYTHLRTFILTHLAAVVDEWVHGLPDGRVRWLAALHLGLEVVFEVRPHHVVVLPPFICCDLCLGLNHCVDSTNCRWEDRTNLKLYYCSVTI